MTFEPTAKTPPTTHATNEERPRKADCVTDELLHDGSMILFHTCQQRLVTLNPTAALIWECCDGEHDIAAIAAEVQDVFPDVTDVEADILATLHTFMERGLIIDDAI